MNFFLTFKTVIKGIFIGITAIIPGINYSAMSVITGTYDKIVLTLSHITHKKPWAFLIALTIGIILGITLIATYLDQWITNYPQHSHFLMIGLILGALPTLYKSKREMKLTVTKALVFLICLGGILALNLFPGASDITIPENFNPQTLNTMGYLFVSGLIAGIGLLLPGTNGTSLLLLIGSYHVIVGSIASRDMQVLLPSALGVIVGIIVTIKLLGWLIQNYRAHCHYGLLGLVIATIPKLWPGIEISTHSLVSIGLAVVGIAIGHQLQEHQ